jgi:predicted RNase H-like nuclease (RuvC/YqgF family)
MSQDKVLHGEDSIRLLEYQRKLSRASSSGSSFDKLPPARYRGDSTSSTDLKKLHDEEVTALTKQLSTAEDEVQKLKKENEKLERKLKEAEEVAHQAGAAATEVSRLEAELEKEKDANTKMLRARTTSPDPAGDDACISLMLSQELESVKTQLAVEVQEKNSLEQQMTNLKQSLVVSGKGDIVKRNEVISDLQAKVRELEKRVEEKDSDIKRQYHVHTRTVSDLQAKLSKERQQREELLQSARNGARPASSEATTTSRDTAAVTAALQEKDRTIQQLSQQLQTLDKTASTSRDTAAMTAALQEKDRTIQQLSQQLTSRDTAAMTAALQEKDRTIQQLSQQLQTLDKTASTSRDTAAMTAALQEKDRTIQQLSQQLQTLDKTARNVTKITEHSKQQSGTIVALKEELQQTQELVAEKEAALKISHDEMNKTRMYYDNILRKKDADLAQHTHQVEQLHCEVADLQQQVRQHSAEGNAGRKEAERLLERSEKERNYWQQKSVQQDMVLQTTRQDVDRLHREVNGLNSTVAAQGKEVERLQRENQTIKGEIETHKITAVTYKEDFESERKDREAVHTRIADMETRYRHQLEAMGEQLHVKTDEAQRHKEALGSTQELLQRQQQQMTAQLQQKEDELHTVYAQKQQLQEDVMSKTQQVKQYKKQIDQLSSETATYKQQMDFLAHKTEELGRQRTMKELQERKLVQLELQCDQLRAENNELRMKMDHLMRQIPSTDASRTQPPVLKSQTLGGLPKRQHERALPTPYMLGRGRSFDEEHRAIGSNVNYQPSHSNHGSGSTPNPQHQRMAQHPFQQEGRAPAAAGGGGGYNIPPENLSTGAHRAGGMGGQHPNYHSQFQKQDTPYSSLPSSGLGVVGPQHQQRPAYAQDGMYSPADMVDKDSPPSSTIGQGQQPPQSQAGQQRRAHSQMLSMATSTGSGQRYLPAPDRPPMQDQPQLYHNLPLSPGRAPNTVPPNSSGGGRQLQRFGGSERRVGGQPNPQPGARRLPHTQDVVSSMGSKQYSTSIEESRRHPTHKPHNPPLEGYVKPQQASPHPRSGHFLAVDPLAGRPENRSTHTGNSAGRPKQGSVSPSQSSGDISKDIDTVIEQTASKMRADELVSEGEGEGIPYDPNLVCPKCRMRFREGEIQKFRRHVSSAHK